MMGAPRILQALARDEIFPAIHWLSRDSGATNEPRYATAITFCVAQTAIMLADLDLIAPLWAAAAVAAMWGIFRYLSGARVSSRWGDVQSGVALEQARRALLRLEEESYHPKNWRPMILALSGGVWNRYHLAEYGYWLTARRGLLTFAQVATGDVEDHIELHERHQRRLRHFIQEEELDAFPVVVIEKDLVAGVKALLQCYGIGGVRPNTVLLGWSEDPERLESMGRILRLIRDFRRNIVIVKYDELRERWVPPQGTIDVWWRGRQNGSLMLLLAHMLVQNREFHGHRIRILSVVSDESARPGLTQHLGRILQNARINATVEIVVSDDIVTEMRKRSRKAAVAFLGFEPPEHGSAKIFSDSYFRVMDHLDTVILVHSAGDIDLEA